MVGICCFFFWIQPIFFRGELAVSNKDGRNDFGLATKTSTHDAILSSPGRRSHFCDQSSQAIQPCQEATSHAARGVKVASNENVGFCFPRNNKTF